MAKWLFKEEPGCYSFAKLQKDGHATWDGVRNNLARQNLRKVRRGDRILFYHTGKEKQVVGIMRAVSAAKPVPDGEDPAAVMIEVEPERELPSPVTLKQIKNDPLLADWDLVRLSRLSIVPVTDVQWKRVLELAESKSK